jgi:transcriptional regulator with XRE-family HTH domain
MLKKIDHEKKFRTNLKLLIKYHDVGIRELGRSIDVAASHLTRLINGMRTNPGLSLLKKISEFFNISIAQLIGEQKIDFKKLPKKSNLIQQ